jgi:hypothetical protein
MARIFEAHLDRAEPDSPYEIERPKRASAGLAWVLVFAVLLLAGAGVGLVVMNGSLENTIEITRSAFETNGTSDTAAN